MELVTKNHPDKLADRIAGLLVDLSYCKAFNITAFPLHYIAKKNSSSELKRLMKVHMSCNVLFDKDNCFIINHTSIPLEINEVERAVQYVLAGTYLKVKVHYEEVKINKYTEDNIYPCFGATYSITSSESAVPETIRSLTNKYIEKRWTGYYMKVWGAEEGLRTPMTECIPLVMEKNFTGATNRKIANDLEATGSSSAGIHGKDIFQEDVIGNVLNYMRHTTNNRGTLNCTLDISPISTGDYEVKQNWEKKVLKVWNFILDQGGFRNIAEGFSLIYGKQDYGEPVIDDLSDIIDIKKHSRKDHNNE